MNDACGDCLPQLRANSEERVCALTCGVADDDFPVSGTEGGVSAGEPETVLVRPNIFAAMVRAAGSTPALALAALITATAAMTILSPANDFATAEFYSAHELNDLTELRWVTVSRLVVAGLGLLLAALAALRHAGELPALRYTFFDNGDETLEETEAAAVPRWITLLVGSSLLVSVLAVALNAAAFGLAMNVHHSPSFSVG